MWDFPKENHGMTSVHSLIVKLTMRQECIPVGYIPPASMAIPCLLGEVPAGHGGCLLGGEVSTCWGVCLVGVSAWQGGCLPNRGAAYKGRSVWWWVLPGGGDVCLAGGLYLVGGGVQHPDPEADTHPLWTESQTGIKNIKITTFSPWRAMGVTEKHVGRAAFPTLLLIFWLC